jgi:hypothetical protein
VQDCDQADWSAVEGDEPEGEDLEDGEVEKAGALIVDCGVGWLVVGLGDWGDGGLAYRMIRLRARSLD